MCNWLTDLNGDIRKAATAQDARSFAGVMDTGLAPRGLGEKSRHHPGVFVNYCQQQVISVQYRP